MEAKGAGDMEGKGAGDMEENGAGNGGERCREWRAAGFDTSGELCTFARTEGQTMRTLVFATANPGKIREAQEILGAGFKLVTPADMGIVEDIPETGNTLQENSLQKAEYIHDRCGCDCFADDTGLEVDLLGGAPGVHTARYGGNGRDFNANMDKLLREMQRREEEIAEADGAQAAAEPQANTEAQVAAGAQAAAGAQVAAGAQAAAGAQGATGAPAPGARGASRTAARTARFRTCVTLILDGRKYFFDGIMEGTIARAKAGCGGFGYDPVFQPEGKGGLTAAEITEEEKNAISHRGKALRAMAAFLQEYTQ